MAALEFLARPAIAALVAPDLTRESRKPPLRRRRLSPQPRDLAPLPSQLMLGFGTEPGLVRREFRHLGSCGIVISAERLRRQRGRMHRTVPALFSHPLYLSSACSYSIDSHDPVGNAGVATPAVLWQLFPQHLRSWSSCRAAREHHASRPAALTEAMTPALTIPSHIAGRFDSAD
jgi:hypothetical protein